MDPEQMTVFGARRPAPFEPRKFLGGKGFQGRPQALGRFRMGVAGIVFKAGGMVKNRGGHRRMVGWGF